MSSSEAEGANKPDYKPLFQNYFKNERWVNLKRDLPQDGEVELFTETSRAGVEKRYFITSGGVKRITTILPRTSPYEIKNIIPSDSRFPMNNDNLVELIGSLERKLDLDVNRFPEDQEDIFRLFERKVRQHKLNTQRR